MSVDRRELNYTIKFNTDKTGLNEAKKALEELKQLTAGDILRLNPNLSSFTKASEAMNKLRGSIGNIETAFNKAFDPTTGLTNITRLEKEFQKLNLGEMSKSFADIGPKGVKAFTQVANKAMTANLQFKQTNQVLSKIGATLGNTIRWQISSQIINRFTGSIQEAWGFVKHLDTSLNDIRIVTGKSADEMDKFAAKANDAAKALGASTTEYTEAALIYYQQGLSDEEAQARSEVTLKAANVTGQSAQQVSEQLTAVWNGYKVSAEETELYVDKLAAVAATTASDLEELSVGMSKVASAANAMGVDVDQLNGMLSTIISVTRQAPETAGTALKTIFARIEDLKISGEDEYGVKLGEVSGTLAEVGVNIMGVNGEMRDLGEVIEEVASKWDTWSDAQQNAIAQAMAGKRQYNNLLALFNNWDMYTSAVETSRNSVGTLQEQQNIYMQSVEAHIQKLSTQWEEFYKSLFDTDDINDLLDLFTQIVKKVDNFSDAIGGGKGILLGLGAVALKVFDQQISSGLGEIITKFGNAKSNAEALKSEIAMVEHYAMDLGLNPDATNEIVELKEYTQQYYDVLSQEEIAEKDRLIELAGEALANRDSYKAMGEEYERFIKLLAQGQAQTGMLDSQVNQQMQGMNFTTLAKDESSAIVTDNAIESANRLREAYQQITEAYQQYKEATEANDYSAKSDAMAELVSAMMRGRTALKNYTAECNISKEESDKLKEKIRELSIAAHDLTKNFVGLLKGVDIEDLFDNFESKSTKAENAIRSSTEGTIEFLEQQAEQIDITVEKYEKLVVIAEKYKQTIKATGHLDTRQMISTLTSLTTSFTTVGFSIQSLSNLTKVWTDETTSGFDKVVQTMISLGMILPGILTVIKMLNTATTAYNVLTGSQVVVNGQLFAVETARAALLTLTDGEIEELNEDIAANILLLKQGKSQLDAETLSAILNTQALRDNKKVREALSAEKSLGRLDSGQQGSIKLFSTLKDKLEGVGNRAKDLASTVGTKLTSALSSAGAGGSAAGAGASAAAVGFGVLAAAAITLVGIITAVVQAYRAWYSQLDANAKISQEQANASKEATESLKTQKDTVNEVVQEYKELNEQYDASHVHELRQATYELCKQHGLQDLAVKALIADYDELNNLIKEAQNESGKDYSESIRQEKQDIESAVSNGIWRNLKHSERDKVDPTDIWFGTGKKKSIDLKGFRMANAYMPFLESTENYNLRNSLEDLGVEFSERQKDHITLDSFVKVATTNYEELTRVLNSSAAPAAQQLLDILAEQSENLDRYSQLLEESKTAYVDEEYRPQLQEVQSAAELEQIKEQMLQDKELKGLFTDAEGVLDEEALQNWVDSYLAGIDTIKDYVQTSDLADSVAIKLNIDKEEAIKQLEGLPEDVVNFIQDHIDLLGSFDNVKDFVDFFSSQIDYLNTEKNVVKINAVLESSKKVKNALDTSDKSRFFSQETIDDLFQNTTFAEDNNLTQEQFEGLDYETQKQALMDYYFIATQKSAEYREQHTKDLEAQREKIQENIDTLDDLNQKYSDKDLESATNGYFDAQYEKLTKAAEQLGMSKEELDKLLNDFGKGNTVDDYDNQIKAFKELTGLTNEQLARLGYLKGVQEEFNEKTADYNKEGKSYVDLLDQQGQIESELSSEIDSLGNSTEDWSEALEYAQNRMKDINADLDSVQSAYNSLTSIIEEYNSTNILSMDNLQTILSMDTEYLAALEIENGQMSLNEEVLKNLALARLDEAEATAYQEAMAELNTIAQQGAGDGAKYAGDASIEAAQKVTKAAEAVRDGAAAWNEYWAAEENKVGLSNEQTEAVGQALYNKLQAIDKVRKQIMSGGLNFKETMATKKDKSSKKDPKEEKALKRDTDALREINSQLKEIESKLKRIQKYEDHSWGKSALKALKQENKLLEQQYDLLKKKKEKSEDDLATRRKQLEDQGVTFTADGSTMTDAEARLNELYAEYNSMVDQYNKMSVKEQEKFKKTLEAKKEAVQAIEKAMSSYESKFNDYNSLLTEIQEEHYELIANAVKTFNHKINLRLELNDAKKEWKNFWYEVVKDVRENDFAGQIAKSMSQLKILTGVGGKANKSEIAQLTKHVEETTAEVRKQINSANRAGEDSIFGNDSELSKETLSEFRDKLMEAVRSAKEEIDNMIDTYLKALDSIQEKIDKQAKGWQNIGDYLEHNIELIKMVSGEKAYDLIDKQYQKLYKNNLSLLELDKESVDTWEAKVEYYRHMVEATPKEDKKYKMYEESLKKSEENLAAAIQKRNEDLINSLKTAEEEFKNTNAKIADDLSKAFSKGLGVDRMKNQWDLAIEEQNLYLDNVERAIEMQDLLNDFDDISESLSGRADLQKEFLKFQDEEISKLKEREKLTQYDIDELRARLEIKKAEMALDDERQNKSNLRLRRDSQGNYTYQYTADEEQVEEAEDKVLTAKKDWYELVKKRNQETAEAVIEIRSRMVQAEKDMADAALAHDQEAWQTAYDTYTALQDMMKDYMGQAEKAKQDFFWGTAQFFSDVEHNTVLPMWQTTVQQMIDEWDNGGKESFIGAAEAAIARLGSAQETFANETTKYLQAAGVEYKNLTEDGIDPAEEALRDMIDTNEELKESIDETNTLLEKMEEDLQAAIKAYEDLKDAATDAIKAANSALETLAKTAISTGEQVRAAVKAASEAPSLIPNGQTSSDDSSSSTGTPTSTSSKDNPPTEKEKYRVYTDPSGVAGRYYLASSTGSVVLTYTTLPDIVAWLRLHGYHSKEGRWETAHVPQFKTGGYTGEWDDSSGRLAMLHQKELVLNQNDTSNMLSAINALRDIVGSNGSADFSGLADAITASAYMSAQVLAQIGSGVVQSIASLVNDNSSINNYKNMTVNADFSGVRSADAIYQALIDLENYGMQGNYSNAPYMNKSF